MRMALECYPLVECEQTREAVLARFQKHPQEFDIYELLKMIAPVREAALLEKRTAEPALPTRA